MKLLRKTILPVLLIILGLVLAFGFTELIVRFYLFHTRTISDKDCRQKDEWLHHSLVPNSTCRSKTKEWDIEFKVNSLGLRDSEYSIEKPENTYRILMLGDSFTEGYGVQLKDIFSKIVEEKLNLQDKERFEVINTGITGYSPLLEYLYLKKYGLEFDPDLVVMNFSMTDFYDDLIYGDKELLVEKDKLFKEEIPSTTWMPSISQKIKWWLHQNLVLYDFLVLRLKRIVNPGVYKKNIIDFEKGNIQSDQFAITREEINEKDYVLLLENSTENLLKIKQLLTENNIGFALVIIPYGHQVNDREWRKGRDFWGFEKGKIYSNQSISDLVDFAIANKIEILDLLPIYKKASRFFWDGNYYYPYDGHWNKKGHQLAAEKIYEFIYPIIKTKYK